MGPRRSVGVAPPPPTLPRTLGPRTVHAQSCLRYRCPGALAHLGTALVSLPLSHHSSNQSTCPQVRVPLILGIWGGKGQGKSFQTELTFKKMGVEPIIMSAGELESDIAGEPGRIIRERQALTRTPVHKWPMGRSRSDAGRDLSAFFPSKGTEGLPRSARTTAA